MVWLAEGQKPPYDLLQKQEFNEIYGRMLKIDEEFTIPVNKPTNADLKSINLEFGVWSFIAVR